MFKFKIIQKSKISKARLGSFATPHGVIETPVFMPVGTVGAVKTMTPDDLDEVGAQIILANTYHLYLRPGDKLVKKAGELHKFMGYNRPILTDSGGFQVFSLGESALQDRKGGKSYERGPRAEPKPAKITDEGVTFYSHLDGSKHLFTPEKSIEIQQNLGADIIMAFDECPSASASARQVAKAVARTHAWLTRCIKAKTSRNQALFPICQGGTDKKLRQMSAKHTNDLGLPGNAIGGVSVGEKKQKIYQVADWCTDILDEKRPRYLMGIGYPEDIVKVISLGVDMFDCVLPTRLARHGVVWAGRDFRLSGLRYKQINLKNAKFKQDLKPIDPKCRCYACKNKLSRAYLRHLILESEPLGIHLLTCHNLQYTFDLVSEVKALISLGKF